MTSSVSTKSGGTRNSQDMDIGIGLSVVPNPVMNELTLKNKFDRKLNDITIIDRNYQVKIKLRADNLDRINISNLVSGLYMIRCVVDDKELVTLPFVKL
ncbi:MAG: T9SS type A sorting domain-containing protein [Saprospiraceae bacterium]|nr:T9SS type A sorting domain-containing protein [Saprospiraceae bacterium]